MDTVPVYKTCFFSRQNSQPADQILFCSYISAGHLQKLFWALELAVPK